MLTIQISRATRPGPLQRLLGIITGLAMRVMARLVRWIMAKWRPRAAWKPAAGGKKVKGRVGAMVGGDADWYGYGGWRPLSGRSGRTVSPEPGPVWRGGIVCKPCESDHEPISITTTEVHPTVMKNGGCGGDPKSEGRDPKELRTPNSEVRNCVHRGHDLNRERHPAPTHLFTDSPVH